jgi:chorismate mutase
VEITSHYSFFSAHKPFIISGPCSAETEEQLMKTAQKLSKSGRIRLLRAGIWKPRTKPGLFEGVGEKGLSWLANAGKETGIPTTTEVGNAKHVELISKYGIHSVWIGARTTVNPFLVEEIAQALRGTTIPVIIKNPVNPDLELWTGALERVRAYTSGPIAHIHRGFSTQHSGKYRNQPMWQLPIEMKRRFPDIPLFCDPSHICGNRHLLAYVAQRSIDLNFDGLMIESHINPDHAWSDAAQQITPDQLDLMLDQLIWRKPASEHAPFMDDLVRLRAEIDQTDDDLMQLLADRMILADKIGVLKKEHGITILQTERWNEILNRCLEKGLHMGLHADFIKNYINAVHMESIRHQNSVMNPPENP